MNHFSFSFKEQRLIFRETPEASDIPLETGVQSISRSPTGREALVKRILADQAASQREVDAVLVDEDMPHPPRSPKMVA